MGPQPSGVPLSIAIPVSSHVHASLGMARLLLLPYNRLSTANKECWAY
jgi:hypothetical protein